MTRTSAQQILSILAPLISLAGSLVTVLYIKGFLEFELGDWHSRENSRARYGVSLFVFRPKGFEFEVLLYGTGLATLILLVLGFLFKSISDMQLKAQQAPSSLWTKRMWMAAGIQLLIAGGLTARRTRIFNPAYSEELEKMLWRTGAKGSRASRQSFGFFDYSPQDWDLKLELHRSQMLKQRGIHWRGSFNVEGFEYWQNNWEPSWSCEAERRLGGNGIGGKWACDPDKLRGQESCGVVSVGEFLNQSSWSFENSLQALTPGCRIAAIRINHKSSAPKPQEPKFVKIRDIGASLSSLESELEALGMDGRPLEILKVDCGGCEWNLLESVISTPVRQVLIRLKYINGRTTHS